MFSASDWIRIRMELRGAQKYIAEMRQAARATLALTAAEDRAAAATARLNRAQYLHNQLLFTGRRLMFYGTLGFLTLGAAVAKLGFSYNNTMQQARVALRTMFPDKASLDNIMNQLFRLAAFTPFTVAQVTQMFRSVYTGFSEVGVSAQTTINTIRNVMDALSQGGFLTEQSIRRISNALQDLAYQGTLTQRMVTRLGQLNIPIRQALRDYLHLTEQQMQSVGKMGISATDTIKALNQYIEHSPVFHGAALRQATDTLYGAWTTFRDFLSQAAGGAETGIFGRLQKMLSNITVAMDDMSKTGKPVTLIMIAELFDKELSPNTHLVINAFITLSSAIKSLLITLGVLFKAVGLFLWPLDKLLGLFGANRTAAKLLGIVIGILAAEFLVAKGATLLFSAAQVLTRRALQGVLTVTRLLIGSEGLLMLQRMLKGAAAASVVSNIAFAQFAAIMRELWKIYKAQGLIGVFKALPSVFRLMTAAMTPLVAETWAWTAALLANPITWIVLAVLALTVGLVLLVTQVKSVNHWLKENYWWLSLLVIVLMGPFGLYIDAVIGLSLYWNRIADAIRAAYEWMKKLVTLKWVPGVGGGHGGFLSRFANFLSYTPLNPVLVPRLIARGVTGRQHGGYASGLNLVGERGPEVVRLPQGSRVFNQTQSGAGFAGGGGLQITVVPQAIYLDRQKVGEVVASVVTDRKARL